MEPTPLKRVLFWTTYIFGSVAFIFGLLVTQVPRGGRDKDVRLEFAIWGGCFGLLVLCLLLMKWNFQRMGARRETGRSLLPFWLVWRKKTDREDARLLLKLPLEDRFPRIWVPSPESRDLRQLLWHRLVQKEAQKRPEALRRPHGLLAWTTCFGLTANVLRTSGRMIYKSRAPPMVKPTTPWTIRPKKMITRLPRT